MNEIKDIEMISIQPYNSSFSLVSDSSNANAKTVRIENVYNWSRFFFVSFNIESLLACSSQHDESKTSVNTWTGLFLVSFPRTFNNWVFSIFDFIQLNSSNSKKKIMTNSEKNSIQFFLRKRGKLKFHRMLNILKRYFENFAITKYRNILGCNIHDGYCTLFAINPSIFIKFPPAKNMR